MGNLGGAKWTYPTLVTSCVWSVWICEAGARRGTGNSSSAGRGGGRRANAGRGRFQSSQSSSPAHWDLVHRKVTGNSLRCIPASLRLRFCSSPGQYLPSASGTIMLVSPIAMLVLQMDHKPLRRLSSTTILDVFLSAQRLYSRPTGDTVHYPVASPAK